jgi:hypothetical protein
MNTKVNKNQILASTLSWRRTRQQPYAPLLLLLFSLGSAGTTPKTLLAAASPCDRLGGFLPTTAGLTATPLEGSKEGPGATPKGTALVTAVLLPDGKESTHLGGAMSVIVSNLESLYEEAQKDKNKIALYLNGRLIPDAHPREIDLSRNCLTFDLKRTDASKAAWAEVLYPPTLAPKEVQVSVGTDIRSIERDPGAVLHLSAIVANWSLWGTIVVFVFASVLFLWLANRSNILRDAGEEPFDPDTNQAWRKPFSLARTQMAFWFFVVLASYLLIFGVTGERNTIPPEVLGLLGISASTALGAIVVDSSKDAAARADLDAARREVADLSTQIAAAENAPAPRDEASIQAMKERRKKLYAKIAPASEGFMLDLLSDANGVSLNRFQMLVWTLVLGIIFLTSVIQTFGMPTFGGTLLAIMGISGATYVGFKFPEVKKTEVH